MVENKKAVKDEQKDLKALEILGEELSLGFILLDKCTTFIEQVRINPAYNEDLFSELKVDLDKLSCSIVRFEDVLDKNISLNHPGDKDRRGELQALQARACNLKICFKNVFNAEELLDSSSQQNLSSVQAIRRHLCSLLDILGKSNLSRSLVPPNTSSAVEVVKESFRKD